MAGGRGLCFDIYMVLYLGYAVIYVIKSVSHSPLSTRSPFAWGTVQLTVSTPALADTATPGRTWCHEQTLKKYTVKVSFSSSAVENSWNQVLASVLSGWIPVQECMACELPPSSFSSSQLPDDLALPSLPFVPLMSKNYTTTGALAQRAQLSGVVAIVSATTPACVCAQGCLQVHIHTVAGIFWRHAAAYKEPGDGGALVRNATLAFTENKLGVYAQCIMRCLRQSRGPLVVSLFPQASTTSSADTVAATPAASVDTFLLVGIFLAAPSLLQARDGSRVLKILFAAVPLVGMALAAGGQRSWLLLCTVTTLAVAKTVSMYVTQGAIFTFSTPITGRFIKSTSTSSDIAALCGLNSSGVSSAYIIQLPMLSLLVDAVSQRRDVVTVGNGFLHAVVVTILTLALHVTNNVYDKCSLWLRLGSDARNRSRYSDSEVEVDGFGGDDEDDQTTKSIFLLDDFSASVVDESSRITSSLISSSSPLSRLVVERSLGLLWSASVILWGVTLGKISFRYFIDAPSVFHDHSLPRDERLVLACLLLMHSLIPVIANAPHLRHLYHSYYYQCRDDHPGERGQWGYEPPPSSATSSASGNYHYHYRSYHNRITVYTNVSSVVVAILLVGVVMNPLLLAG